MGFDLLTFRIAFLISSKTKWPWISMGGFDWMALTLGSFSHETKAERPLGIV